MPAPNPPIQPGPKQVEVARVNFELTKTHDFLREQFIKVRDAIPDTRATFAVILLAIIATQLSSIYDCLKKIEANTRRDPAGEAILEIIRQR